MECTNCNGFIEEPVISRVENCPHCGVLLLIPSRKEWEMMKANRESLESSD